ADHAKNDLRREGKKAVQKSPNNLSSKKDPKSLKEKDPMALELKRTLQNAVRLRTIVGIFAKHGFHNIAERIKLGKFLIERLSGPEVDRFSAPQRMRIAFEELGPTFVKLGQLLATRPDLVPDEYT